MLRPRINKPFTSQISFWLPALFSVVIAVSAHEETLSRYAVLTHLVKLVALVIPSIQGWHNMQEAPQPGLLMAVWSWISMLWLLILMLPHYIRWRCQPERFEIVSQEQAFGNRAHIYKNSGPITDILLPYIICFVAATFLFYSYESPSFYSITNYAECQRACSIEWLYFCLGMLFFSYIMPLLFIWFTYITLDLKTLITQKLPYQAKPGQ